LPKLKNKKGNGIKVESIDDVAGLVDSNLDSTDYVLFFIENSLFDGWVIDFLVICFTLHQTKTGLQLINTEIVA